MTFKGHLLFLITIFEIELQYGVVCRSYFVFSQHFSQTLDLEGRLHLKFFVVELGKILWKFPELMKKPFSQNKKPSNRVIM